MQKKKKIRHRWILKLLSHWARPKLTPPLAGETGATRVLVSASAARLLHLRAKQFPISQPSLLLAEFKDILRSELDFTSTSLGGEDANLSSAQWES